MPHSSPIIEFGNARCSSLTSSLFSPIFTGKTSSYPISRRRPVHGCRNSGLSVPLASQQGSVGLLAAEGPYFCDLQSKGVEPFGCRSEESLGKSDPKTLKCSHSLLWQTPSRVSLPIANRVTLGLTLTHPSHRWPKPSTQGRRNGRAGAKKK